VTVRAILSLLVASSFLEQRAERTTTIAGRIIAYRPVDRISQVVSFAPNLEIFLMELETPGGVKAGPIVKVEYEHFGYSDITEDILDRAPHLRMKVQRNRACDESYRHFLNVAPSSVMRSPAKWRLGHHLPPGV